MGRGGGGGAVGKHQRGSSTRDTLIHCTRAAARTSDHPDTAQVRVLAGVGDSDVHGDDVAAASLQDNGGAGGALVAGHGTMLSGMVSRHGACRGTRHGQSSGDMRPPPGCTEPNSEGFTNRKWVPHTHTHNVM